MADPVEAQVDAYNAGDLDAFVACFADDVVITQADGDVQMSGRDEMRERYAPMFARGDVRADIVERIRVGRWVVDHERLTRGIATFEALVAYHVDGDVIRRMIILA